MKNITRLTVFGVAVSLAGVVATARPVGAQTREARGTVTAVTETTLSMRAGEQPLTVFVDSETHLQARRIERDLQKEQPGRPSPRVSDFFAPGQAVLVRYREEKGRNHALDISRVGSAGGGISEPQKTSEGKVKAVTASQLTIEDSGHEMTFAISKDTDVLARGATKTTKAAGGKTTIASFVHSGDTVSVSYTESGGRMMASEVRVRVVNH